MYSAFLILHSVLRWAVLLAGILAMLRGWSGWSGRARWTPLDERASFWFVMLVDLQLVVGLVLYGVLSPLTRTAFADMGAAMHDATLRFYAVEHVVLMLAAVAAVHIGRVRMRKAATDTSRFRTAAVFFTVAVVLIVLGIPWPFRAVGRPWITI